MLRPKKKNVCLLFDENFKQGRSVDFLFYFISIFYLILNRVGSQVDFFFHSIFFSLFMYQGLERKK